MAAKFFLLLATCGAAEAFRAAGPLRSNALAPAVTRASPVAMQFGSKKTTEEILEEQGYWPGEWVCADCGYIYEPSARKPFEELRTGWKCPQCAGPRRRFVKKAGGVLGNVDDSPLIYGTVAFAVLTALLVYVGLTV